ncbi:hypothetical protein RHEC894_CH01875 [Rhizobium sp. CIAT894]|uniref:hypothetical protein n=1 Tax=Rhizobium sp. CIAT894 TaxID=2020312 RepID=UPI000A1FA5B7|nr:hypothetical protein [Rhizobium sp. CIAT894]ARM88188.1 hypothetical protein RHEC894_CH01875 [Rhizobium sp. CIAT894]
MSAQIIPFPEPGAGEDDFLDFYRAPLPRKRPAKATKPKWQPTIVDDWPDEVPVFVEELELFELYLGDDLDRILGITK